MTASRTILAIAAAAAIGSGLAGSPLAASSAWAQSGTAASPAASAAPMTQAPAPSSSASTQAVKPRSDAQVDARIKQLHKQLKITKDQESDWNAVAQDMRDNARAMSSTINDRNGIKPMNAADNLKSYAQIADTYADGLKKIAPDFEKLYDAMSAAQKKIADTVFNQRINQRVRTTAAPAATANHS